jgi:hypothetical protein
MTELDFIIDDRVLLEDLPFSTRSAEPAAVEETYFIMPVRMCVSGVELFRLNPTGSPWLSLPVLGFAAHLREALGKIRSDVQSSLSLAGGGRLDFLMESEKLEITCSLSRLGAADALREVTGASSIFCQKIQVLLRDRVPQLVEHPSWRQWFPE